MHGSYLEECMQQERVAISEPGSIVSGKVDMRGLLGKL